MDVALDLSSRQTGCKSAYMFYSSKCLQGKTSSPLSRINSLGKSFGIIEFIGEQCDFKGFLRQCKSVV